MAKKLQADMGYLAQLIIMMKKNSNIKKLIKYALLFGITKTIVDIVLEEIMEAKE